MPPEQISVAIPSCALDPASHDFESFLARFRGLVAWATALVGAGARRVTVVQRSEWEGRFARNGVEFRFVRDGSVAGHVGPYWGRRLVPALCATDPQVVHVDGFRSPLVVRHLRARLPRAAAIVVQDHGGIHAGSPGFDRRLWRAYHGVGTRSADGFLFTAREQSARWVRAGLIAAHQTVFEVPEASSDLVPPTTIEGRQPASDASGGLPGRPALLWVGRLDANKDPLTVLAGFERATAALPDAALTMVFATGGLRAAVEARIASTPALRGRVHLRGRVEHDVMAALYASADLFVLGSHHEGSGYALIEALAFGVTPVVTDIPSFRAITGQGQCGALFRPDDAEALGSALARLGSVAPPDAAMRRRAVAAYFKHALSWSAVGARAMASYTTAIEVRRSRVGSGARVL